MNAILTSQPLNATSRCFSLPIANDVRLVSIETARAVCGLTSERIIELAEDHYTVGHLPAFDLSLAGPGGVRQRRRELRFWSGALRAAAPSSAATSRTLDNIIADCLLTNPQSLSNRSLNLNSSQLECAWCVSNQLVLRLIAGAELTGVRVGRNWRVNRFSVGEFLRRRAL